MVAVGPNAMPPAAGLTAAFKPIGPALVVVAAVVGANDPIPPTVPDKGPAETIPVLGAAIAGAAAAPASITPGIMLAPPYAPSPAIKPFFKLPVARP